MLLMKLEVAVEAATDDEGNVKINIHGDTLGILIGRRGETLDALQYLTSLNVNHGQDDYTRVTLDTENYRAKREEALKRLANRIRANVTSGLSDSREVRSNIEWRLSPKVSVEGSYDNVNDISSSSLGNLGADIRWRLEFE